MTDRLGFQHNEASNSPNFSDEEVASALPTGRVEDIAEHLGAAVCSECGKGAVYRKDERCFRFPHFYWRALMTCEAGHAFQKVFQITWMYNSVDVSTPKT